MDAFCKMKIKQSQNGSIICRFIKLLKSTMDKYIKCKFVANSFSRLELTIAVLAVVISKKRKTLQEITSILLAAFDNV